MPSQADTISIAAAWRTGDIYETAALTSLFSMVFVVIFSALKIAREPIE